MIRLFVGIPLPEPVTDQLDLLCTGMPDAHWVDSEGMHITLRFIGEVDEGMAEEAHDALATIEAKGFTLNLGGIGTFGEGYKTRAVWVGVEASEPLSRLQSKVESTLVRAGLPPEGRKFKPHVTLARFNRADVVKLQAYVEGNNLFRTGPIIVDSFTLFESRMGKGGSVYTPLAEYPLL